MEKILVTGSAGFIGMHLCKELLKDGYKIMGIDNMNDYYDPKLKKARLGELSQYKNYKFREADISDWSSINTIFDNYKPHKVVNLAAQAGVRYSLTNPQAYIKSNILGFMNILEACRHHHVSGLIYASSSSVYGGNEKTPFSTEDLTDRPISIYAASKKSNELMAYTYSHLYGLNTTGLRYFTVYGPWGRPDMAMYIFTEKIYKGEAIEVFNHGEMERDFTYIDDIINGTKASIIKNPDCKIFNLGNNNCEDIMEVIKHIEKCVGKKAQIKFEDIQPGDVKKTFADIDYSKKLLGYSPKIKISTGIPRFVNWYKAYFNIQ